jgi:hypothetical protein
MVRKLVAVCGSAAVAMLIAGCGGAGGGGSAVTATAELDPATGAVILPSDRFVTTMVDDNLLTVARTAAAAVCAREQGVQFMVPGYVEQPIYLSESFFGPWTMDQAQKFGFAQPAPDADLRANGQVSAEYGEPSALNNAQVAEQNAGLSDSDLQVVEECNGSPDAQRLTLSATGAWQDEMGVWDITKLPGADEVFDDLYSCYRENGMEPEGADGVPGFPLGADPSVINEEQITLAVQSVECKEKLGTTQKLADLWATAEAPAVEKYAKELTARADEIDTVRREAKAYIADHPEVFVTPR